MVRSSGASQAPRTCPAPLKTGAKCIELSCSALVAWLSGRVRLRIDDAYFADAFLRIIDVKGLTEQQNKDYRQRLALDLCNGGGGFPLMAVLSKNAYIGSLALTASLVKRVAGNKDPKVLFPEASAILADGFLKDIERLAHLTINSMYNEPYKHVQQVLSQHGRQQRLEEALKVAAPQQRALILSAADPKAAAWLACIFGNDKNLSLSNEQMRISLCLHLGLPMTNTIALSGPRVCLACSPNPYPAQPGAAQPVLITNDTGLHAFSCKGGGQDSAAGSRNTRHCLVSLAIENSVFQQNADLPDGHCHVQHEPAVLNFGVAKLADPANNRADFAVTRPSGLTTLYDTSIAFPGLASHPTAHELKNAGIAVKHRHDAKTSFYADRWTLNENVKLMPLILETGGRWHPDVTNEIKRHLKDVHRSNIPQYVYHLKATTQRVAVALRRMVVKGIVALHRRLGGYPLAQGVGAGAGAGGPGGPGG